MENLEGKNNRRKRSGRIALGPKFHHLIGNLKLQLLGPNPKCKKRVWNRVSCTCTNLQNINFHNLQSFESAERQIYRMLL